MRLGHLLTLLPLCIVACMPLTTADKESESLSETNNIGTNRIALQSINGDFDGDGESECATLYHIPEEVIMADSTTVAEVIEESYIIAFDDTQISPKVSTNRLSHLTHLGDINNDGKDEYGIYSDGESSWGHFSAYCNREAEWQNIASTTLNIKLLERIGEVVDFENLITADAEEPGNAIIRHITILDGEKITSTKESVQLI